MARKFALTLMTAVTIVTLSACNTIAGLGRDVESVGETVEDAAT